MLSNKAESQLLVVNGFDDYSESIEVENWEIYLIKNQNSSYTSVKPIPIENTLFSTDKFNLKDFSGVCWFRSEFKIDSGKLKLPCALKIQYEGALEIFINRKKIGGFGLVGDSEQSEKIQKSSGEIISYDFAYNKTYEILIRFSDHSIISENRNAEKLFGFKMCVMNADDAYRQIYASNKISMTLSLVFLIFFSTLAFLHIIIFLYNRDQKANLYYASFCLSVGFLFSGAFIATVFGQSEITERLIMISPSLIFSILPLMLRSFFKFKFPKWYFYLVIIGLLSMFGMLFQFKGFDILAFGFIAISSIESIRNLYIGFREKVNGVKIIGTGIGIFLGFIVIMLLVAFLHINLSSKYEWIGLVFIIFLFAAIVSIPISITVFLAYTISLTNKSLANKLIEVENLSAKSIEQEKEKQHILANQNITLEKQVKERTSEITEQKKIIEEKNKDIIDSINYAKRIQSAMLPEEKVFNEIFTNSFVLYQPRDIVSGDFYYAVQIDSKKLIIAADCTGHGVPGALMSMVGCNIINKLSHENHVIDPKTILETLHKELRHALKQDSFGSDNRDGMDAAAVLITDDKIIYAGANRPLIYFNSKNELSEIKPTKTAIGGSHIETINIEEHIIESTNIKQLYLFSDGFADQFGGPEGKKLMVSKFKLWLSQICNLNTDEQKRFLEDNFMAWKKESEQVDDVLVIGIKI